MVPTLTPDCGQLQLHLQKSTCSESKLCILYTLVHMFLRYKMYHTQLQQYSVHSNRLRPSSHFPSCAIEDGASVEMYPAWLEPGRPSMAPYFRRPPPGLRAMREALGVRPRLFFAARPVNRVAPAGRIAELATEKIWYPRSQRKWETHRRTSARMMARCSQAVSA